MKIRLLAPNVLRRSGGEIKPSIDEQKKSFAKAIAENWLQYDGWTNYCIFCQRTGTDDNMRHAPGCITEQAASFYLEGLEG